MWTERGSRFTGSIQQNKPPRGHVPFVSNWTLIPSCFRAKVRYFSLERKSTKKIDTVCKERYTGSHPGWSWPDVSMSSGDGRFPANDNWIWCGRHCDSVFRRKEKQRDNLAIFIHIYTPAAVLCINEKFPLSGDSSSNPIFAPDLRLYSRFFRRRLRLHTDAPLIPIKGRSAIYIWAQRVDCRAGVLTNRASLLKYGIVTVSGTPALSRQLLLPWPSRGAK